MAFNWNRTHNAQCAHTESRKVSHTGGEIKVSSVIIGFVEAVKRRLRLRLGLRLRLRLGIRLKLRLRLRLMLMRMLMLMLMLMLRLRP